MACDRRILRLEGGKLVLFDAGHKDEQYRVPETDMTPQMDDMLTSDLASAMT